MYREDRVLSKLRFQDRSRNRFCKEAEITTNIVYNILKSCTVHMLNVQYKELLL